MGDDITIGVTEITNLIEVTSQPNDQIIDIAVTDNTDNVTVNVTPSVIEINIIKGTDLGLGNVDNTSDLDKPISTATQSALDLKVPYTGATSNVNLGEFQLSTGQITFDQTPTQSAGVGVMRWNDVDGTLDLGLKGGNVTLQLGQEQVVRIVNKTASNLTEAGYQAVYTSGAQGQRLKVDLALANSDLTSSGTLGIVTENIAVNQEGFVTTNGLVRGVNTTGSLQGETWVDGDILYLSPTIAGRITNIKPIAPQHLVVVGVCVYAHITQGSIFVKVDNGYELDELHNVLITSIANNEGLFYETSTGLWKNKSISTVLGYTPASNALTISTTSPLNGGGDLSANRTLSISQSNTTTNGYLSSIDWNTFNDKQSALSGTGFVKSTAGVISYDTNSYYLASNPSGYTSNLGTVTSVSMTVPTGLSISGSPITSSDTLGLTFTTGYSIPTDANQTNWATAYTNRITSLTTTGSSGASTLLSNVLNIPNYTLSGLGGQPLDADLTAIAGLAGTSGFLKKTATDTWTLDTNTYLTSAVTTLSGGTTGLTPNTATSGAITLAGTLVIANGGTGSTTASGARTNLGATTIGGNIFTSTNPTAITFLRANADNTVSWLDATTFRAAIGAGTSSTVGTVTSVSALSFGTTGTDLSSTVATGTTTPVITLNVPTASATNRGALSSADWTTFNGKQNALTNPVTGTGAGATNTIPKFTGVNDLGNSGIIDNGTTVNFSTSNVKITGADATTRFSVGNSSSTAYIDFYGQTHATIPNDITLITNSAGRVRFFTTATERASILANGNFLIGTTTDSGDKLRVNGTTLLGGNVNIAGIIKTSTSTGEFLRSDATVAGASQTINIYNSAGTRRMLFGYGSTSSESLFLSNDLNGDIILKTNATERINISSAGVVKVNNLSGTGTRMVTADLNGNLGYQAIPSGGTTNLGYTASPTNGIVTSDTGTDATIPLADGTNAGLLAPAGFTNLSNAVLTNNDQTITGLKTFDRSATNPSSGINLSVGTGSGSVLAASTTGSNTAVSFSTSSSGIATNVSSSSTGTALNVRTTSSGLGLVINSDTGSTGNPFTIQNAGVETFSVNKVGDININKAYAVQVAPTAKTATATLTIAEILTNITTVTSTTAVTLTLPTGTLTDAGVQSGTLAVNESFEWTVINLGSSSGAVTMAAETGHTYVGATSVAIGTSATFRTRKTAANTFVTYRI